MKTTVPSGERVAMPQAPEAAPNTFRPVVRLDCPRCPEGDHWRYLSACRSLAGPRGYGGSNHCRQATADSLISGTIGCRGASCEWSHGFTSTAFVCVTKIVRILVPQAGVAKMIRHYLVASNFRNSARLSARVLCSSVFRTALSALAASPTK